MKREIGLRIEMSSVEISRKLEGGSLSIVDRARAGIIARPLFEIRHLAKRNHMAKGIRVRQRPLGSPKVVQIFLCSQPASAAKNASRRRKQRKCFQAHRSKKHKRPVSRARTNRTTVDSYEACMFMQLFQDAYSKVTQAEFFVQCLSTQLQIAPFPVRELAF